MARVVQVIETEITRGRGDMGNPMRTVTQYWSLDGDLLAERDPVKDCIRGDWLAPPIPTRFSLDDE